VRGAWTCAVQIEIANPSLVILWLFQFPIDMSSVPILAATFGIASHLGYFIHSEHDMQSLQILRAFITGPLLFFACRQYFKQDDSPLLAAKATLVATVCYFTALTVSILTYRVFFHPLRHFPGPFLARVSKITHFLRILPKLNNYVQTDLLHRKYGDIVRQVFFLV
jgi:hypothetical protein